MRTRFFTLAVALAALTILSSGCAQEDKVALGEFVRIPGTQIRLAPAQGYTLSTSFAGLENKEAKSSITVTEVPGPYSQLLEAMSAEALKPRGMTVRESKELKAAGYDATLVSLSNSNQGVAFENRMLMLGTDEKAVLIVAAHPDPIPAEVEKEIVASLLSLEWTPDVPIDPFDGLGFKIPETDTLKVQRRIWNGLMLRVIGERGNVFLFASSVPPEMKIDDLEQFSVQRLRSLAELRELGELDGQAVEFGGLRGYEVTGNAKDAEAGTPIVVYQMVLSSGSRNFLLGAIVGEEGSKEYLEKFRAAARSLELTS